MIPILIYISYNIYLISLIHKGRRRTFGEKKIDLFLIFRYAYQKIQNSLKRFLKKKTQVWFKGKIRTPLSQNIFTYFSVSEHSASFSLF